MAKCYVSYGLTVYFGICDLTMAPNLPITQPRTLQIQADTCRRYAKVGAGVYYPYDDCRYPMNPQDKEATGNLARTIDADHIQKLYETVAKDYPDFKLIFCPPFYWGPDSNSDGYSEDREEYLKRMSHGIIQQNWYYRPTLDPYNGKVAAYNLLDEAGFDQIPLCSAYVQKDYNVKVNRDNVPNTLKYCREMLDPSRLLGYGVTRWHALNDGGTQRYLEGWRYLDEARRTYYPEEGRRVHDYYAKINPNLPPREFPPLLVD